jgi:hypothetical protein
MTFETHYDNYSYNSNNSNSNKINKDNNSKLEKKEQIPTEYNEEQTLRVIRKQHQTAGEGRSKTINDIPTTAALAQILKDLEFPADKSIIVEFIRQKKFNDPKSSQILPVLEKIEEKQYHKLADITKATKLVQ